MSFATDLKTVMNADSTINGLVSGIYFLNAPDNIDLESEYIVYNYELIDDISSFDAYSTHSIFKVTLAIYSNNSLVMDNIKEAVDAYLNNYEDSNFLDVHYIEDERGTIGEKNQYLSAPELRIFYKN